MYILIENYQRIVRGWKELLSYFIYLVINEIKYVFCVSFKNTEKDEV